MGHGRPAFAAGPYQAAGGYCASLAPRRLPRQWFQPKRDFNHRIPGRSLAVCGHRTLTFAKRGTTMKKALAYVAIAFALATGITATVVFQPEAAFACATGDCSG